ncbi:MAG: mannose-6-phosphate isomerase, class I [Deltaproteobacteria bacterium]|nr:mannose-6-phosphate isomerase, class I [Deltaproteobacteria bacterium]
MTHETVGLSLLRNPVMNYAWGSRTAIADLLGQPQPAPQPEAELWLGDHPRAPSLLRRGDAWVSLATVIGSSPAAVLGEDVARRFGGRLPFLLKVLAAARPLSIQAHPDREQARRGFDRENAAGIPLAAAERSYSDDNHKPELLCALQPFCALCSLRPAADVLRQLEDLGADGLGPAATELRRGGRDGWRGFLRALLTLDRSQQRLVVDACAARIATRPPQPALEWVARLASAFPGDIGALAPLFLNLVRLQPGQALYQPAGELHAYLDGVGLELMANSDNVLRGGLTPKHVDVDGLLEILTCAERPPLVIRPEPVSAVERIYRTPADEFSLSVIDVDQAHGYRAPAARPVEILICVAGQATVAGDDGTAALTLGRGASLLAPAGIGYAISGRATVYRATVPPAV